jgi:polyhydroxyalkanoate synthesis repressor PhaR
MSEAATKTAEPVTIKKYANRRLYNTGTSAYVTLEDLAAMVKTGEDFVVYDAKTGEDITRSVLTQIIFEQENKEGQNLLPITFLRQLIRFYGDSMQMLVPRYLANRKSSVSKWPRLSASVRSLRWRSRSGGTWTCSSAPLPCSCRSRGATARAARQVPRLTKPPERPAKSAISNVSSMR